MNKFVKVASDKLKNNHGDMGAPTMFLISLTLIILLVIGVCTIFPTHDTVTVYGDDGVLLETYSGDDMGIHLSEKRISFAYNKAVYSFTIESYAQAGDNSYKVVINDSTAKTLGLKTNGTSNIVSKNTDTTVSDNSSPDSSENSQECSNAATTAVKYAKGEIESNSAVNPTLLADTQAYLAKLGYDKSIIVQEISVNNGNVNVTVVKDNDNNVTKSETTCYFGKDVDLK